MNVIQRKRVIRINTNIVCSAKKIVWFIVFLAFIKPEYLARNSSFDNISNYIRMITCILSIMTIIVSMRISQRLVLILVYVLPTLVVTIISEGDVYKAISSTVVIFTVFALFENLNLREIKHKVEILNILLFVIVLIDVVTVLVYPNGLYKLENTREIFFYTDDVWFLGFKNDHPPYYFLACFTSVLCLFLNNMKKKYVYMVLVIHITSFVGLITMFAGSGIYSFVIYIGFLLFFLKIKSLKVGFELSIKAHLILFALLTTFSLNPVFVRLFSLIGKEHTMAVRANIWNEVWEYVFRSPFWGHGYENSVDLLWLQKIAAGAVTSHNTILDMLLRGGCITAVTFFLILVFIGKNIRWMKIENKTLYIYLTIIFFATFLLAQTEGFMVNVPIFMMIAIMANLNPETSDKSKKIRLKI